MEVTGANRIRSSLERIYGRNLGKAFQMPSVKCHIDSCSIPFKIIPKIPFQFLLGSFRSLIQSLLIPFLVSYMNSSLFTLQSLFDSFPVYCISSITLDWIFRRILKGIGNGTRPYNVVRRLLYCNYLQNLK